MNEYRLIQKMLSDITGIVTTLFEYSDRFKPTEEKKSQEIATHFQKIEQSLLQSAEQLENNNRDRTLFLTKLHKGSARAFNFPFL